MTGLSAGDGLGLGSWLAPGWPACPGGHYDKMGRDDFFLQDGPP